MINKSIYLSKAINYLAYKMKELSGRLKYYNLGKELFSHRDCLETIDEVLKHIKPKYLCDIGANAGYWSLILHKLCPDLQHVVMFEPQSEMARKLEELNLKDVKKVIYKCAVGEKEGRVEIKGGTPSASILSATEQKKYFPGSLMEKSETVEIRSLDNIYRNDKLHYPDLIKIDVQGYELEVLRGASNTLAGSKYLVIELSFRQLYDGQPYLWEILKYLSDSNYEMIGHGYEWRTNAKPTELLQMDAIFINNSYHKNDYK
jgi:FkbM family methyltransferase